MNDFFDKSFDLIVTYGGRVLLAIIVLIVGLWLIKRIVKIVSKRMEKREVDVSLRPFLRSIIGALLKIMLIISVATMIAIEMTSFVAVLAAAGLAVGLALQGSLANFAGGVLILLLKPFKVGDFIDTGTYSGTVREIQIFYTYITTTQNQEVIIPNAKLSNDAVTNYSANDSRRLDVTFRIGYDDDMDKTKDVLERIVKEESGFIEERGHSIFVEELADNSVNIHVRGWLKNGDDWPVFNSLKETVKKAFDIEGISIPLPQRDIRMIKE